jgi:hypothetical protein
MKKNILLTLLAVTITLLVCDGLFRVYEHYALSISMRPKDGVVDLLALNYNDSTVPQKKPAGEFRVLDFGDSYAYSIVKYPASYHGVAKDILVKTGAVTSARLVNFGEPSTSFNQYIRAVNYWTPLVECDAVVVNVFLGNDVVELAHSQLPDDLPLNHVFVNSFMEAQTGRKRLSAIPHVFGLRMLDYAYAHLMTYYEGYYIKRDIPEPYIAAAGPLKEDVFYRVSKEHAFAGEPARCQDLASGWKGLANLTKDLERLQRERGIKVAIILSPADVAVNDQSWKETAQHEGIDPATFDPNLPSAMARAIIGQTSSEVPVLDLTPVFRCAEQRGDSQYYPRETHWNAAGNKLAGEAYGRFIATNWLGVAPEALNGMDPCVMAKEPEAAEPNVGKCLTAAGFAAP